MSTSVLLETMLTEQNDQLVEEVYLDLVKGGEHVLLVLQQSPRHLIASD
jgi:hypothetical protein